MLHVNVMLLEKCEEKKNYNTIAFQVWECVRHLEGNVRMQVQSNVPVEIACPCIFNTELLCFFLTQCLLNSDPEILITDPLQRVKCRQKR